MVLIIEFVVYQFINCSADSIICCIVKLPDSLLTVGTDWHCYSTQQS